MQYTVITRTGENNPHCGSPDFEQLCGRPLGLTLLPNSDNDTVIVTDAGKGLLAARRSKGTVEVLMGVSEVGDESENQVGVMFGNSVVSHPSGEYVYYTESSTRYPRSKFPSIVLRHDQTGRLCRFDMK
eukprot:GHVN01004091.1.p1 GENE.GHVN01004091.1~~GHVN01004091.1.p1  ORF type:complete len:129 (+),score=15.79 GHVN01004091.1:745-1131(+)